METRTEIKVFRVELKCDKCKKGTMICTDPNKVAEGDRRKHQCSNDDCQVILWIPGKVYPRTEYEGATMMQQLTGAKDAAKKRLKDLLSKAPAPQKPKTKSPKK